MVAADWSDFVAKEEVIVVTRFSFFGKSGWKSDFSRDPDALFNEPRLRFRLELLSAFPLASLAAQTDQNFHLFILTANALPRWALKDLRKRCLAALPPDKFSICQRAQGVAAVYLRRFLEARADAKGSASGRCIHMPLDDDDGLAVDFIQDMRTRLAALTPPGPNDYHFLSFSKGYALDIIDFSQARLRMYKHNYPFINLGLTMCSPVAKQNILSVSHRKFPKKHEHKLIGFGNMMYLRCVHGANDSRVEVRSAWKEIEKWRSNKDIKLRFDFLEGV
jgi:hypothetical protein